MCNSRRRALAAFTSLGLLALTAGCSGRSRPRAQPVARGATVLALGDSLTHGTGAAPEAAYPAMLEGLTGWRVVNAGVSGDTSAQALARLPALLAEHAPALVLIGIGGNDFLRRLPEADTRANVRRACELARDAGAQVLLIAVPRPTLAGAFTGSLTDHPLYGEIAEALKLPLQRQGWAEVLGDDSLRSDRIHANAQGYARFAQSVAATAVAAGLLVRP
ncbi:MAG: GDSL-type esterase/lipase family protein [Burkholderiaceae bacterium]